MRARLDRDWAEQVFAAHPPMVLSRAYGTALRLTAYAYQFPHPIERVWDDWLQLLLEVRTPKARWRNTEPCMLTWELAGLAEWVERIASGDPPPRTRPFLEPLLSFSLTATQDGPAVRVGLGLEFYPTVVLGEWPSELFPVARGVDDPDYDEAAGNYLDFPISGLDLPSIVAALRGMLAEFPERTATGSPRRSEQP